MTKTASETTPASVGQPFPLKRHFYRRIVPGLVLFLLALIVLSGFSARQVMRGIYLNSATERAQIISKSVSTNAPEGWALMLSGQDLSDFPSRPEWQAVNAAFRSEVEELRLVKLKAYAISGHILFSMNEDEIGIVESNPALRQVIADLNPGIVSKTEADGSEVYELYAPVFDDGGNLRAVFELYEPTNRLNTLLQRAILTAAIPPGLMLAVLIVGLGWLVGRAQNDIDTRTQVVAAMKARVESLVSSSAIEAARRGEGEDLPTTKKIETIFYSDVRDFSGFADQNPPERVVRFLNDLMEVQVRAVANAGGDVDKMVGDAVLARFEGPNAAADAVTAAHTIQEEMSRAALARGLGIGIYTGEVIAGAIGPSQRRDFTVIGNAVNLAARLCSEARAGEIVADAATAERSNQAGFGDVTSVTVKGRREPLLIRRMAGKGA